MKKIAFVLALVLTPLLAAGDDAADAEAKVREYFDAFNEKNIEAIVARVYSLPVHVASGSGHRAYVTADDARSSLSALYGQIEAQGWRKSVIREVKACPVAAGLVFAEVNYTRDKADGTAIAPGLRSNVYVVQKLEPGWRITAFYGRDIEKGFSCSR